jgi:hypothetical protein
MGCQSKKRPGDHKHLLFIVWTEIIKGIFKDMGRPPKHTTVSEHLQSDCLRFYLWQRREECIILPKIWSAEQAISNQHGT